MPDVKCLASSVLNNVYGLFWYASFKKSIPTKVL